MPRHLLERRQFLKASAAIAGGLAGTQAFAAERPAVVNPRATSGDRAHEPNWAERLTITVGPKHADLVGANHKVLQAAVDMAARLGGGTVRILPGTYRLRNAVYLASGVRIQGSGTDSVLVKEPSITTDIVDDSDWYDQEITLEDASGFQLGDGVCLRTKNPDNGATNVLKRTLVARSGNRFKLDKALRENYWVEGKPTASTLFPILSGELVENIVIEDVVLDGNRSNNAHLDGNYAGCIFLQDCNRITMRGVTTRNYHGDGISWQICHDVVVENCHSHDNADLGLHPGSGSQRPIIRGNRVERNKIGIFFCWGVRYGLAENNEIVQAGESGISIGHCDTDNLIVANKIVDSGRVGVLFRDDGRGKDFWPNRNRVEKNQIINSGPQTGIAVDIQGQTKSITLVENQIRETRGPMERIGVQIGAKTEQITLKDNTIDGFASAVADRRKS